MIGGFRMNFSEKDCCNPELCSSCKGRCCKETGCFYMPEDFESMDFECLKTHLDKGFISIAVATNSFGIPLYDPVLYLKIRNKNAGICVLPTNGECMLLTSTGCKLSFEERPSGGKGLIPNSAGCYSVFKEGDVLSQWKPYSKLLRELWNLYSDLSVEETIKREGG